MPYVSMPNGAKYVPLKKKVEKVEAPQPEAQEEVKAPKASKKIVVIILLKFRLYLNYSRIEFFSS